MPVAGAKPKTDRSQVRHRIEPVHEWTEVEDVPYAGAPPMRSRATGGISVMITGAENSSDWPEPTVEWYRAISTMPHAKLWGPAEWQFVHDSCEIHARTIEAWRGYAGPEIRAREKLLGTLADYRRDLRIRYVEPKSKADADAAIDADNVVSINSLRDL
jgi:hypothetical protein